MWGRPTDLMPVVVAILFDDVPQEHRLFTGWVMMGRGVEVENGVCGLAVHFVSQRIVRSSVNTQVQEWEVAFTFGFSGELNGLMDAV
jgi:hypothetical protein